MHCLDGGLILVDHSPQIFARADCCSPCVWPILGLILGSCRQDVSRFFFRRPGRFCARCRCSLSDTLDWRLFSAWQVVGDWQRRVYPPSIKEVDTWQTGFPALGRSVLQLVRCAPCIVLKAGTPMWERVCDQPRRHTGQLRGTGDSEQGSICVELLGLF